MRFCKDSLMGLRGSFEGQGFILSGCKTNFSTFGCIGLYVA